jgi:hypothetical protein
MIVIVFMFAFMLASATFATSRIMGVTMLNFFF